MDTSLFDELENFGKDIKPKQPTPQKKNTFQYSQPQTNAMDKLLREASEYDKESVAKASSRRSKDDAGDYNEALLDGPSKVIAKKEDSKPTEPLGYIFNPDGKPQVVHDDPYLEPHTNDLMLRQNEFKKWLDIFQGAEGGILNLARSYKKFGLQVQPNNDITFMEWCPGAKGMRIFGDFNAWNRGEFHCKRNDFGCFCITLKALPDGTPLIKHKQKYKIHIEGADGSWMDRNSAYAKVQVQEEGQILFDCMHWDPPAAEQHKWEFIDPVEPEREQGVRIYESHVGMAQEEGRVNSYRDYADRTLPRVKKAGYNYIQLMAIQEHSYYGSFGYHVTGFFGVSSRSGTPEDFKYLVDKAHSMGIKIIIDLVHSHASNNVLDGINKFDGTDHSFSHAGDRGYHSGWDSMLFDYSKYEVKRFLLSNLAWFLDEYKVDGFRFDAVTSILYQHHGIGFSFSGDYNEYFGLQTDLDGIVYLMLANTLIKQIRPNAITIGEDVSGFPTLCREIRDGGIGFDYRLAMFLPDMWIKMVKEMEDESWSMGHIVHSMTNRRWKEKVVAYVESHDQAIVGDKTQSMWLFDQEIYHGMDKNRQPSLQVSRGVALHKMIRLITQSLGGDAYLNFMGNEFGHPEWIDFPREGNNNSYHYCRRQWSLLDNTNLRFIQLGEWDKQMIEVEQMFGSQIKGHQFCTLQNEEDKVIVYERGELVYIYNFHPNNSYTDYQIGTHWRSDHMILIETDEERFGGHQRLNDAHKNWIKVNNQGWAERRHSLKVYIPSRCAIVLAPFEWAIKYPELKDKMPNYDAEDPQYKTYVQAFEEEQKNAPVKKASPQKIANNSQQKPVQFKNQIDDNKETDQQVQEQPNQQQQNVQIGEEVPQAQPKKKKIINMMDDLTLD